MTAWTTLATTAVDADSPGDTDLAAALVNRDLHLREFLTGATPRYNDRTPHDHSGLAGDAVIHKVSSPNLVENPCPEDGNGDENEWVHSGVGVDGTTQTLTFGASASDSLYHRLLWDSIRDDTQHGLLGTGGAPMVLSFFAKAGGTDSAGVLYCGISDGGSYGTGHRFELDYSQLSSSVWKRFYCVADKTSNSPPSGTAYPGAAHSTDIRLWFSVKAANAFTNDFLITGFSACVSDGSLTPFNWGPHEHRAEAYGRVHDENRQPKAPIWDTTIAMTNAVELTTRA